MATVIFRRNPFDIHKDIEKVEVPKPVTVRCFLEKHFGPEWKEFDKPTYCLFNAEAIARKDWNRVIDEGDTVQFLTLPGGSAIVWLWVAYAVTAVATIIVVSRMKPPNPVTGQTDEAASIYTLRGQRNQIKLGLPIESPYGLNRLYPAYAAQPYNKYINNDQWLFQVFCVGQGKYVLDNMKIEDTPLSNFPDITTEIVPPGAAITLFPDNVDTSAEVSQVELRGPNESGSGAVWVEDSPGDVGLGIDPTGHYTYGIAGPFVANAPGTTTTKLEVDVALPRGLYIQNDQGTLSTLQVTALFEARLIDNAGAPLGAWFTIATFDKTLNTNTPQRFTLEATVPVGRYEVRGSRTNNKNTDVKASNVLTWESLRAFLPSGRTYGNVTLIAMKAKATNNLNDNSQNRFNLEGTRMLHTYDAIDGWSEEETPTRGIVWAFLDVFRAEYGGRMPDHLFDYDTLLELDTTYTGRSEYFDGVFDQRASCWEVARKIALVGRAVPMLNGSRITMVRDVPKTIPTAMFNQENIVAGSWAWDLKLVNIDANDGLKVTYMDPTTNKPESVLCLVGGEAGNNPKELDLSCGIRSRQHAYNIGYYLRARERYQNQNIRLRTGLEGHLPTYGDLIAVAYDPAKWGMAGAVKNATGPALDGENPVQRILTLNEPVNFDAGGVHKIALRKNNATVLGPLTVTAGADAYHVSVMVTASTWEAFNFDGSVELPTFIMGPASSWCRLGRIAALAPGDDDTVEVTAINDDNRIFAGDGGTPPPNPGGDALGPAKPQRPTVTGLKVLPSPGIPNEVIATWNAALGAQYYVVQLSYNGAQWETMAEPTDSMARFRTLPQYLIVRVAAFGSAGLGDWAYWTGTGPGVFTSDPNDNDLTPDAVTGVSISAGFGFIVLQWTNPTNTAIKELLVYENTTAVLPATAKFVEPGTVKQKFVDGLPDNALRYYWIQVKSTRNKLSTVAGPFSATTTNGITLDHLIPGGLQPVEILTVLPSSGNYQGRIVYLTADDNVGGTFAKDKMYRWTSPSFSSGKTYWTSVVPAVDITGQLTNSQIADLAAAKISGQLTDAQIAAIAAAKVTGQLIDSQLAAIAAAKITGQVSSTQIADDAITTPKLAAGAVTAAEIAAGAIIAGKIAAGAIVAGDIASNAITTVKLDAGAVTTAKLAALAVTANEIAANAITAAKIAAGEVTTAKLAAGAVTANELAANAVTAGKIQAGAITATAVGANEIIALAANIKDAIITSAKILTLAANKIEAGTISVQISLETPKISTVGLIYNTAASGNTMPAFASLTDDITSSFSVNGSHKESLLTLIGWSSGSGYAENRFGKSDMKFVGSFYSAFTIPANTDYADTYGVYRINGGAWTRMAPGSRNNFYSAGGANTSGAAAISGLNGTDTIEFGVEVVTPAAETFNYASMHLTWGNL
jgi:hypothetical protein